jgi:hypothetical protein
MMATTAQSRLSGKHRTISGENSGFAPGRELCHVPEVINLNVFVGQSRHPLKNRF